jgi:hypothetical protein
MRQQGMEEEEGEEYDLERRIAELICSDEFQKWLPVTIKEEDISNIPGTAIIKFPFEFILDQGRSYALYELIEIMDIFILMIACYNKNFNFVWYNVDKAGYCLFIEDTERGITSKKITNHQY